ncbi:MAG TPA: tRNA pseudouridine(38-40) synthase TruA [Pseudogracilibacillus sp.]|nr:tRNA pseudouridine(38-40) synthase TruA [Pseudogracilibacillus sp.]
MQNIKCTIAYDGSTFSGSQIQPQARTVQGEVEKVLKKMHKDKPIRIYPSGRTDAGVHALGQVFHFKTDLTIPETGWHKALQSLLPRDIQIKQVRFVEDTFHARFSALDKEYRYIVLNTEEPDLFRRNFTYHSAFTYDIEKMQAACKVLEGEHDFTSFASTKSTVTGDKIRTIYEISCHRINKEVRFSVRGSGFLQHMVRIIVGTLLDIGCGNIPADELTHILEAKDREKAGITIPPEGLYLWEVNYEKETDNT